jgi:hypothetical protein
MIPQAITTTVLTHPLQMFLAGVILLQGARAVWGLLVAARRPGRMSHPAPAAGPGHLRAA